MYIKRIQAITKYYITFMRKGNEISLVELT